MINVHKTLNFHAEDFFSSKCPTSPPLITYYNKFLPHGFSDKFPDPTFICYINQLINEYFQQSHYVFGQISSVFRNFRCGYGYI